MPPRPSSRTISKSPRRCGAGDPDATVDMAMAQPHESLDVNNLYLTCYCIRMVGNHRNWGKVERRRGGSGKAWHQKVGGVIEGRTARPWRITATGFHSDEFRRGKSAWVRFYPTNRNGVSFLLAHHLHPVLVGAHGLRAGKPCRRSTWSGKPRCWPPSEAAVRKRAAGEDVNAKVERATAFGVPQGLLPGYLFKLFLREQLADRATALRTVAFQQHRHGFQFGARIQE